MRNEPEEEKCVQYAAVRNNDSKPRSLVPEVMMLHPNILPKLQVCCLRVECRASFL